MVRFSFSNNLEANRAGYEQLARLATFCETHADTQIELGGLGKWCDAHLCAALGAIIARGRDRSLRFVLGESVATRVKFAWGKNGFWPFVGGVGMNDEFDTTLAFEGFNAQDEKRFAQYLSRELLPKELPRMSDSAKKRFGLCVQEIFNNAITHDAGVGPKRVFCCGQNYPSRDCIAFSISDLGVGFRRNVEGFLGQPCPDGAAIDWALAEGHTTKGKLGGLGLALLWEWIQRNDGELQIVSHLDFWQGNAQTIQRVTLGQPFPGTVVTLKINTWDEQNYETFFAAPDEPLF